MEILWTVYIVGAALVIGGVLMLSLLLGMFTGEISVGMIAFGIFWGLIWPLTILWCGTYYGVIEPLRERR